MIYTLFSPLQRYQNDEDIYLDTDDEELFLTEDQREELNAKREAVLRRMIPPTDARLRELPPEPIRKRRKRVLTPVPLKRTRKEWEQALPPEYTTPKKRGRKKKIFISESD